MNVDGGRVNDLRERNQLRQQIGIEIVKDDSIVSVSKEQNIVEDDGFRIDGVTQNANDGNEKGVNSAPGSLQISQQQQSQGAIVCWESFLHLRSLKVLLVENDDSTRHIVTALLRNCSYEVIEAANGLQAWKILEDLNNHIDLVLTEVVMPFLSGIGLLYKIMSHKSRKNVPVIMMSSHDSMGLVFKCLSKGAVDFLVKPIRKNELKNLWQHVWRRCHSSSGSGSESGTHTQKSVKSKGVEKSENSSGSNDEEENGSIGLNVGDGSDDGSRTQSSWTKQAVEVDSPRPVSSWDQVAECPDSTCAQVIHSNAEISAYKQVHAITAKKHKERDGQIDNIVGGQDLDRGFSKSIDLQRDYSAKDLTKFLGNKQNNLHLDEGQLDLNSESPINLKHEVAKPANTAITHINTTEFEPLNRSSKVSDSKNKAVIDAKETPPVELSLKRLRGVEDVGITVQDDRNVLRRSDSSAFSRYNAASNVNKASSDIKTVSPHDTSLDIMKRESVCNVQSHSNGDQPNQGSNVGSNNIDMGSTTSNTFTKSAFVKNKPAVTSMVKCLPLPSSFQPMKGDTLCASQQIASEKADDVAGTAMLAQPMGTHEVLQGQHLSRHYDHHPHLVHNMQQQQHQLQQLQSDHDDSSLKKMAAAAPHCGSSNVLGGSVEGNACNYGVNGSASGSNHGSNHGSNGQNGSSTAVNAGAANIESDNAITGKRGSGDASGSGSGSGNGSRVDQNKFAHREAALTKFRQKRKDRCFRKKVRYQSRKKLAEQRPRVRGQFVRQTGSESANKGTES